MKETVLSYEVRWARTEEWDPVVQLVWKTFMKYEGKDYSPEGIRNFKKFIYGKELRGMFLSGRYQVMVAAEKEKIIGVISVRNANFISLLFVDGDYHRRGVGRKLLETMTRYLKEEAGEPSVTVQSSPFAVGFYHRLGFYDTSGERTVAGIRTTPMELVL